MLYKYCHYNPDVIVKVCFSKYKIRLHFYPYLIFLLVCLINLSIRADATFGLLLAMLECKVFNGGLMLFTKDNYTKKESLFRSLGLTNLSCWQQLNEAKI